MHAYLMNSNDLSFRYPDGLVPSLEAERNTAMTVGSKVQCPTISHSAVASQGAQRPHSTFGSRVSGGAADVITDHSMQRHTHAVYSHFGTSCIH